MSEKTIEFSEDDNPKVQNEA